MPMSPPPAPAWAWSSVSPAFSVMMQSAVSSTVATLDALTRAERSTFAGVITPALSRSS